MFQIDDLEPSYSKYGSTYMSGFDSWPLVTQNTLLPNILAELSTSHPPTPPQTSWSLDAFFLLPYTRLRYYGKLYARLLRSTKEGRSDHKLLVTANQKLDGLVNQVERRLDCDVAEDENQPSSRGDEVEGDRERQSRASSGMNSSLDSDTG